MRYLNLARMEATLAAIERDDRLIRVLFNNAGIYHPGRDWLAVPPEQFDDTMSVHVRVPFFASQWVAKRLIAAGETGAIHRPARQRRSRVWRIEGRRHQPDQEPRHPAGPARRLCQRHRSGSDQHSDGCACAAGGEGRRDSQRPGSLRRAGEIASVVDFLVSDAASFITCATIDVNGGL